MLGFTKLHGAEVQPVNSEAMCTKCKKHGASVKTPEQLRILAWRQVSAAFKPFLHEV